MVTIRIITNNSTKIAKGRALGAKKSAARGRAKTTKGEWKALQNYTYSIYVRILLYK